MATSSPTPPDSRQRWDARHAAGGPGLPSSLLLEWVGRLGAGRAIDLACGRGANLLLLAEHGWSDVAPVAGVDISPVALHIAAAAARARGLKVDLFAADVTRYPLPKRSFDLVCVFRFLDRALAPRIGEMLRPGGVLIYQTFTVDQLRFDNGPRSRAWLLERGELRALFAELSVLQYEESVQVGRGRGEALASLVARRV